MTTPSGIPMETSESDDRSYRYLVLEKNSLPCLLVSDPKSDKASAALDVAVGQYSDGSIPGLAHFLEHMLFMGTEKFPDENEYQAYLSAHGGSSNAFTDQQNTNYYFDVTPEAFHGALDRFAQFFCKPLFAETSLERERLAVDSEHAKNLQSDHWRFFQLSKTLCRQDHPYANFGSGNVETLTVDNIRDKLIEFHDTYYSAHGMRLVVLGTESLDTLETYVTELFEDIPLNKDSPAPPQYVSPESLPFGPTELAKLVKVVPVKEHTMTLDLQFCLREIQSLHLSKPTRYISHLLGHEGKGSILSLLKELHWAHELSSGESRSCTDWSSFVVSIHLTEEGLNQVAKVMEVCFAYLNMLRELGPQEWVHEETSTQADCSFRFLSKRNPMDYTSALAGYMHMYPPEYTLSGPYKIHAYEPDRITEILSYLTPKNMIAMVAAKKFEETVTLTEKWYGTKYSVEDLDSTLLQTLQEASIKTDWMEPKLSLPERNDMLPSDFTIRKVKNVPDDQPTLLQDDETCRLWYKPDNVFDMPKVNFMAQIRNSVAYESPESTVLTSLWCNVLEEHCNEFTYLASMAGLHFYSHATRSGVDMHVSGYNHKVNVLIQRVVRAVQQFPEQMTVELFDRVKKKLEEQFQSFVFSQPYQHAFYGADLCLLQDKWTMEEKMMALQDLTPVHLVEFSKRFLSRFHLEALVHGNASPEEAKTMIKTVLDGLQPSTPFAASLPTTRVAQLPANKNIVYRFAEFNPGNTNHAIKVLYQIGPMDLCTNATLALVHHLIKEPAFNELRTQEQLGYIVHTSIDTAGDDIKGLLFLIQSDSYDPKHLDARVEAFVERFRNKLVKMSAEEFDKNVNAVVQNFLEKNKNLGEESSKYWNVVTNRTYLFRKYQQIAAFVKDCTKQNVLRFWDRHVAASAPQRRKLSVQVVAGSENDTEKPTEDTNDDAAEFVSDPVEFKRTLPLYPLPSTVDVAHLRTEVFLSSSEAEQTTAKD